MAVSLTAEALLEGGGLELAGLQTKIPELLGSVELAQGFLFLVDYASQAQHHRSFEAGYVNGKRFVEGLGSVLVLIGGRYGAALALGQGSFGPLDVRAAAGRYYLVYADGIRAFVGKGKGAGEGTVRYTYVAEIVNGFVEDHRCGGLAFLYGHQFHYWRAICIPRATGRDAGGQKKGPKHSFHAYKVSHSSFEIQI